MPVVNAAIYCRISQDREGAGLGVERQRVDCEALAKKLGWKVGSVYVDNDVSAYSGKRRPEYERLMTDLGSGRVNGVLVWHTDRLHRSPRELEDYIQLCERVKAPTQTVQAGSLDLATPSGRMVARMLGAAARQEVEHKSERTKRAQLQAAQAGKWLGGARPFGWTLREDGSAVLNRAEAAVVRKAAKSLLAGLSLGSVVRDLNARGVTTSTGRLWSYTSLRQVLTRSRNCGLITLNGEIVGHSPWPPLLTEDAWRTLVAMFEDPARRRSSSNRVKWLLAGIAICGVCNNTLRSATASSTRSQGTKRTIYRCTAEGGGRHIARSAVPLDDLVRNVVAERLGRSDASGLLAAGADQTDVDALRVESVALRARLAESAESYADGLINRVQLERISAKVQARLGDIEASLASSAQGSTIAAIAAATDPAAAWRSANLEAQRAVIRELLTVRVLPSGRRGNVFDPELVEMEWKA